jgi:hypothetical protein
MYIASLQRVWIDQITDWVLVKPIRRLAHDLAYFDDYIVDRAMGIPLPSGRSISTLAQVEKRKIATRQSLYSSLGVLGSTAPLRKPEVAAASKQDNEDGEFARGTGFAGNLTQRVTAILYWFEDRLVIRGVGEDLIKYGHRLGLAANKIEQLLLNPGYLALFVLTIILVAL